MRKLKMKKYFLPTLILLGIIYSIVFIKSFSGNYSLDLVEGKIDNEKALIAIPSHWVGYDTREVYEKKDGYDKHLIYVASDYGRFPRLYIYEISNLTSEDEEKQYEDLNDWDSSRQEVANNQYQLSIIQSEAVFSGNQITFKIDTNMPILAPTILCKDWITIDNNDGYVLSICEREKRWERLDKIYNDIITSFTILN